MEPVTHFLTGACIGRSGLNRKTRYATVVAVLAAEAADLDVLWGFAGPVEELKHHRGFTHTFLGAPVVAGLVFGVFWLVHLWRERRRNRSATQDAKAPTARPRQPVHWGWLYLTALIAALSHILLDWSNNYGVHPFFPFNDRWYAGSFEFIYDPVVWAILLLALIMPWIFGLVDREIGVRRKPFRGRGWAIFALCSLAALGCLRWWQHGEAITMVRNSGVVSAPIDRIAAEPYPTNPFHWRVLVETPRFYQTAEVNTWSHSVSSDPHQNVLYKPTVTPAVEAAKRTLLGRVYGDWGRWAIVQDVGQEPMAAMKPPQLPRGRTWTTVIFSDLRFRYGPFASRGGSRHSPLSGWVYIVDGRYPAGEGMGRHVQP